MPITMRHSGNAAPALAGAALGGQGERQSQDAKALGSLFAQREARETQQQSQMMGLLKQAKDANQRAFLARVDHLGDMREAAAARKQARDWQLEDRAHAEERQDALLAARQTGATPAATAPAAASAAPVAISRGFAQGLGLTREMYEANRGEYDKAYAQARAIQADETLTDAERAAALRQIRRRLQGIAETPTPPAEPTMSERWGAETYLDESGARYGRDKNGKWYQIAAAPAPETPTAADPRYDGENSVYQYGAAQMPEAEYWRLYAQFERSMTKRDADGNVVRPDPEDVHEALVNARTTAGYMPPSDLPVITPSPISSPAPSPAPAGSVPAPSGAGSSADERALPPPEPAPAGSVPAPSGAGPAPVAKTVQEETDGFAPATAAWLAPAPEESAPTPAVSAPLPAPAGSVPAPSGAGTAPVAKTVQEETDGFAPATAAWLAMLETESAPAPAVSAPLPAPAPAPYRFSGPGITDTGRTIVIDGRHYRVEPE